jgi:UDPglucose 6-dehydrogenase
MHVCVHGLWHLGTLTAACFASAGHAIIGLNDNSSVVSALERCEPPLYEPGLADLILARAADGRLTQVSA